MVEVTYRDFADRYRDMATSLGFEGHIAIAEAMTLTAATDPPDRLLQRKLRSGRDRGRTHDFHAGDK